MLEINKTLLIIPTLEWFTCKLGCHSGNLGQLFLLVKLQDGRPMTSCIRHSVASTYRVHLTLTHTMWLLIDFVTLVKIDLFLQICFFYLWTIKRGRQLAVCNRDVTKYVTSIYYTHRVIPAVKPPWQDRCICLKHLLMIFPVAHSYAYILCKSRTTDTGWVNVQVMYNDQHVQVKNHALLSISRVAPQTPPPPQLHSLL